MHTILVNSACPNHLRVTEEIDHHAYPKSRENEEAVQPRQAPSHQDLPPKRDQNSGAAKTQAAN